MRVTLALSLAFAAWALQCRAAATIAQDLPPRVAARTITSEPAAEQKFRFILFWKEDNAATQKMLAALKASLSARADRTSWSAVNITDPVNQAVVEQYKMSRTPMPLVLCVAPNGAVTGIFPRPISESDVRGAMVTPTMTQCMKALQDGKIVVVHVKADPQAPLPKGANEFAHGPEFQARTFVTGFYVHDPAEERFLKDMDINRTAVKGSVVSLLAPPGVLVGKFSAAVSKDQIAAELHAAGKCCDDPNCPHNQKAK